jgi:F0F1-type ATP synthase membrane subunit b/b'
VVVSSDNGRRLAVFDCDNWECLGKLRFESSTQIQRFEISVEPTGRFVFVADYDACNLFCIEICRDSHGPRFASCTQITFCNPLICIAPIGLNDAVESLDLSLEDDDGAANTAVVASFVVITHRSLVELMVDLEHTHTEYVCSTGSVRGQEEIEGSSLNVSTNSAPKTIAKNHSPRPTSGGGGAVAKLLEAFEDRFGAMNERIDDITNQLEQVQKDNAEQQEHLCDVLEKISHEVRERDERTDANVKNLTSLVRDELFQIVERSMNANTTTLQNSLESTNERAIETIRSSISQVLVPAVDELCSQLFNQLNEAFRDGLQEFVEQIRKVQSTAPTPLLPDYSTLLQLVEANQTVQAFEMVLARHDTASLMFLCNKLDPDTLFNGVTPFPATVLFALLQQLSQSLDRDTDLKFRYIENILLALDNEDPPVQRNEQFRVTLHQLSQALTLFMALDVKASYKRQTRIINQLIVTLLR